LILLVGAIATFAASTCFRRWQSVPHRGLIATTLVLVGVAILGVAGWSGLKTWLIGPTDQQVLRVDDAFTVALVRYSPVSSIGHECYQLEARWDDGFLTRHEVLTSCLYMPGGAHMSLGADAVFLDGLLDGCAFLIDRETRSIRLGASPTFLCKDFVL
jgi:hypothetical protein